MTDKIRARLFNSTVVLATTCLLLIAPSFLADRYDWAQRTHDVVQRYVQYPACLLGRDRRCAAADVWTEVVRDETALRHMLLAVRQDGSCDKVDTPAGQFWVPAGEELALAEELAEQQAHEYGDTVRGVHPGDVVLDCGASIGVFTRQALRSGASRVVAIEPAPWTLECLRKNLSEEIAQGRVVVYPKGVWDHEDRLELSVARGRSASAGTVVLGRGTRLAATVPLTTIDRLVDELQLSRVDFIKMDIEGAEPNALRGAVRTVTRFHPRLAISLEHRHSDPDTIPDLTRRLWPDYHEECGPCRDAGGHVQPTVMFARTGVPH